MLEAVKQGINDSIVNKLGNLEQDIDLIKQTADGPPFLKQMEESQKKMIAKTNALNQMEYMANVE